MKKRFLKKITAGLFFVATLALNVAEPVNSLFTSETITVHAETQQVKDSAVKWELDSKGALILSGQDAMPDFRNDNDDCPWYKDRGQITEIVIGDSITYIGDNAFRDCSNVTSVTIPDGVVALGENAFSGCKKLEKVNIPESLEAIGQGAFAGCLDITFDSDVVVDLESGSVDCDEGKLNWVYLSDGTLKITGNGKMTDKTTYSDDSCPWFPLRNRIKKVVVGDGVKNLRKSAFKTAEKLEEVVLGNSVKYIGISAFSGCSSLKSIKLPEGLEAINEYAFYGCETLADIKLPSTLKTLGEVSFYCCCVLKGIDIPDGVTSIGKYTFRGCSALAEITLPKNLTYLGEYSLADTALVNVNIPDTVTEIASCAFLTDDKLASVHLPASLTTMGSNVFNECSALKSIEIPDGLEVIKEGTFFNCSSLNNISISNKSKLKEIEKKAFSWCCKLQEIYIPVSMNKINDYSFDHTDALKTVIYCGTAEQWDAIYKGEGNVNFDEYLLYHKYEDGACIYCKKTQPNIISKGFGLNYVGKTALNILISCEGDINGVSVNFIFPNGKKKSIPIKDGVKQSDGIYMFSVDVSAQQINSDIHITVENGSTRFMESDVSFGGYLKNTMTNPALEELTDALVGYGYYADAYFNGGTADPKHYTEADYQNIVNSITPSSGITDADYIGSSLILKSDTILRHYFSEYQPGRKEKNGLYYIEKRFSADAFDSKIEGYDCSIYDYIHEVLSDCDEDPAFRKLCAALYEYGQAAAKYVDL